MESEVVTSGQTSPLAELDLYKKDALLDVAKPLGVAMDTEMAVETSLLKAGQTTTGGHLDAEFGVSIKVHIRVDNKVYAEECTATLPPGWDHTKMPPVSPQRTMLTRSQIQQKGEFNCVS